MPILHYVSSCTLAKLPSHHLPLCARSVVRVFVFWVPSFCAVSSIWVATLSTCCARFRRRGGSRGSATFVYPGTGAPLAGGASFAAVEGPEALAAPAFTGSCPRKVPVLLRGLCSGVPILSVGLFEGCGSGGAGSQLRMAFSASSVSGSLSPFVACPSQVCLGCVPGIVEDDAVDLGLVLGLVLEVEEEEEERGLALFCEVVLMSCGFVLWSNRLCSRVSDFGAALARVLA